MKKIFLFLALMAGTFSANAQLLWKISGNGIEKPSYIFGTHHVANKSICDEISGFDQAYESVEQVIGEVETALMNDKKVMMKMMPMMMMPDGQKLSSLFTEEEVQVISDCLKNSGLGLGLEAFDSMKPIVITSTLQVLLSMEHFPDGANQEGIDSHLQTIAKADGKVVGGLETVEFQADMLYNEDLKKQAEDLLEMAEDMDKGIEQIEELAEIYQSQDMKKIGKMIKKGSSKKELEKLLYGRNRNWIEQMKVIIPQTPTLFVVGAGHLPGKNGVLDLLKKEGYKVEPIW